MQTQLPELLPAIHAAAACSPPACVLCAAGNVGPRRLLWFLPLNRPLEALKSALHMIQQRHFSFKDHQQMLWRCCSSGPNGGPEMISVINTPFTYIGVKPVTSGAADFCLERNGSSPLPQSAGDCLPCSPLTSNED